MFTKKPKYTTSEIQQQARDVQDLVRVRSSLYTESRLLKQKDPNHAALLDKEVDHLTMNIKSAQKLYQVMVDKLIR